MGRRIPREARTGHHELLQRTFGAALDDRAVADLTRIMGRLDRSIRDRS